MAIDPRRSYYRVLMVDQSADSDIIHTVFRRLARRFHPDADPGLEAALRMREITEAYATLRDPAKRAAYDAQLAARRDRRTTDRWVRQPGEVAVGSAGAPIGPPIGTLLDFGRYSGWTLGQIKQRDPDFLEWLVRAPIGRQYRDEIRHLLQASA